MPTVSGAGREGASTAAFSIPDSTIQVMLDAGDSDAGGPSGFYEVADVDAFHADHRDSVNWVQLPQDLPPIRFASFADPAGTLGHPAHRACRPPRTRAADPGSYSKGGPGERWLVKPNGQAAEPEWRRNP